MEPQAGYPQNQYLHVSRILPNPGVWSLRVMHMQPQLQRCNPNACECNPNLEEGPFAGLKGPSFGLRGPSFVLIVPCVGLRDSRFCPRKAFSGRQRPSFCRKGPLSVEKTLFLPLSALFDVGLALTLKALESLGGPFVGLKRLSLGKKIALFLHERPLCWFEMFLFWHEKGLPGRKRADSGRIRALLSRKGPTFRL